jgi:DNA-binding MarR family transcriptional regulator
MTVAEKLKSDDLLCQRSLGYWIRRIHNTLVPRMEKLFETQELTFTQWIALVALRDNVVRTAAELSRHLSYDPGATTRLLDLFESKGYVERQRSKEDRRIITLTLTPDGGTIANRLTASVLDYWNRTLTQFSQTDLDVLLSLLIRLFRSIEKEAR